MQIAINIQNILLVCSLITSIAAVITIIKSTVSQVKAPNKAMSERMDKLEEKIRIIEEDIDNDNQRIEIIEKGNRVTQQAILALMKHALNGNDIDKLKEAEMALEEYLIKK